MLVPKNSIKSCQKYIKVVEYWHGTIKNYRYNEDVSPSSWPSSPAPHRAPETTSPLGEPSMCLRLVELGSRSASLSPPSPVKIGGKA